MNEVQGKKAVNSETQVEPQALEGGDNRTLTEVAPRATLRSLRAKTEINAISRALEESGWNRKRAAKLLSISYRGLLYKIRQHNITPGSMNSLTRASGQEM